MTSVFIESATGGQIELATTIAQGSTSAHELKVAGYDDFDDALKVK